MIGFERPVIGDLRCLLRVQYLLNQKEVDSMDSKDLEISMLRDEVKRLESEVINYRANIKVSINKLHPHIVHACEGAGPEDLCATLYLSISRLLDDHEFEYEFLHSTIADRDETIRNLRCCQNCGTLEDPRYKKLCDAGMLCIHWTAKKRTE